MCFRCSSGQWSYGLTYTYTYLRKKPSVYTKENLRAYKSLDALNYPHSCIHPSFWQLVQLTSQQLCFVISALELCSARNAVNIAAFLPPSCARISAMMWHRNPSISSSSWDGRVCSSVLQRYSVMVKRYIQTYPGLQSQSQCAQEETGTHSSQRATHTYTRMQAQTHTHVWTHCAHTHLNIHSQNKYTQTYTCSFPVCETAPRHTQLVLGAASIPRRD